MVCFTFGVSFTVVGFIVECIQFSVAFSLSACDSVLVTVVEAASCVATGCLLFDAVVVGFLVADVDVGRAFAVVTEISDGGSKFRKFSRFTLSAPGFQLN